MTAALSRADQLRRARAAEAPQAVELADIFCRGIQRRIAELFRGIRDNDDVAKYRTARRFLDGEFAWLEEGLTAMEGAPEAAGRTRVGLASRRASGSSGSEAIRLKKALLVLALVAALAGAFLYGFIGRERRWFPYYPLRDAYRALKPAPVRIALRRAPRRVGPRAARGRGRADTASVPPGLQPGLRDQSGVLVYDEARAFPGWNLALSAHRAQALLLDMPGLAHHRWSIESRAVWPDLKDDAGNSTTTEYWRRAELLPGGDLLVVWEYIGLARVDRRSRLKWASANGAHHDLAVAADGTIYVLTRETKVVSCRQPSDPDRLEDFVTMLSPDGEGAPPDLAARRLRAVRLRRRPRAHASEGDLFHANSDRHPRRAPREPLAGVSRRQPARLVSER